MEYASAVWSPHSIKSANELEMVQRRAARYTLQKYHRDSSVSAMLAELAWKPLAERRAQNKIAMMYRMAHDLVAIDPSEHVQQHKATTRVHNKAYMKPR